MTFRKGGGRTGRAAPAMDTTKDREYHLHIGGGHTACGAPASRYRKPITASDNPTHTTCPQCRGALLWAVLWHRDRVNMHARALIEAEIVGRARDV